MHQPKPPYVLAIDQGTSSSRAVIFDATATVCAIAQSEFTQIYPQPGWVEHNADEIWATQIGVCAQALAKAGIQAGDVAAIGITNQRETTVVWDARTGKPIHNAIVWQSRQSAAICEALKDQGHEDFIRERTGLMVDAYFSGSKIRWILDTVDGAAQLAKDGHLRFGTIDSWLVWKLTGGKTHITDYSNASRTMLFNIDTLKWDEELLRLFDIPASMLPQVVPSSMVYAHTDASHFFGARVPIAGMAGDQQAALFGQACWTPGMAKNTYGTGCFMLLNTGEELRRSHKGLLSTIAWGLDGKVHYALEGSIFVAGAAIQWLRDGLKLLDSETDTEYFARKVPDSGGVFVVPAFVGLGAPYWDSTARGAIFGLTRGTSKYHLIRATLDSICYQTGDVLEAMMADSGLNLTTLRVDGGAVVNNLLMQFQADILNVPVDRAAVTQTTSLGAAYLAGLAAGVWKDTAELEKIWKCDKRFIPAMDAAERTRLRARWHKAVERSMQWEEI